MPRPLIYAHRGSSLKHPENTRAAFMAAIEDGADGFECDLRLTKDGEIVIWHDSNLQRIANSKANIAQTQFSELQGIYPQIMRLPELLELAITHKKSLALETKHPVPSGNQIESKVIELVKGISEITISLLSFSWLAIEKVGRELPELENVALLNTLNLPIMERFSNAKSFAPEIVSIRMNPSQVSRYQNESKRVFTWTVNEISDLELAGELGVDVVITDIPARAVSVLGYP